MATENLNLGPVLPCFHSPAHSLQYDNRITEGYKWEKTHKVSYRDLNSRKKKKRTTAPYNMRDLHTSSVTQKISPYWPFLFLHLINDWKHVWVTCWWKRAINQSDQRYDYLMWHVFRSVFHLLTLMSLRSDLVFWQDECWAIFCVLSFAAFTLSLLVSLIKWFGGNTFK